MPKQPPHPNFSTAYDNNHFLVFDQPLRKQKDKAHFLLTLPLRILNLLPQMLNAHNLSSQPVPRAFKLLLGLGLRFCLTPKKASSTINCVVKTL
jgi:hypothetical protein